jgi:hypothetical protein
MRLLMLDDIDRICEREFQEFCSLLLYRVMPGFQAVGGSQDKGDDGFYRAGEALFQMYGPRGRDAAKLRTKIDQSLSKATSLRSSDFPSLKTFAFVTNFDLHHDDHVYLQRAAETVGLACDPWGKTRLAAVLAKAENRDIRDLFPRFLMPDIVGRLDGIARMLRELVEEKVVGRLESVQLSDAIAYGIRHPHDTVIGPDYYPDTFVFQKSERSDSGGNSDRRAYDWFRIRLYCDALVHPSFEPSEEDEFLADVCAAFWESASRSPCDSAHVAVERRGAELEFHRRWEWWTDGVLAFASTLPEPSRPGIYSVADLIVDVTRFFGLAMHLGSAGPARVVFEIEPHRLRPDPAPSDARARETFNACLDGILEVARPILETSTGMKKVVTIIDVGEHLASAPDFLAAQLVVKAMRDLHKARIDSPKLIASIPALLGALDRARRVTAGP